MNANSAKSMVDVVDQFRVNVFVNTANGTPKKLKLMSEVLAVAVLILPGYGSNDSTRRFYRTIAIGECVETSSHTGWMK